MIIHAHDETMYSIMLELSDTHFVPHIQLILQDMEDLTKSDTLA